MKKIYSLISVLLIFLPQYLQAQQRVISCGTVDEAGVRRNVQLRNEYPSNRNLISQTQIIPDTIHVIVHVLWSTSVMNIPDSMIQKQLDILNADFPRLNADTVNTPAPFAAIAGRLPVYFALAHQDSMGAPITGIIRVQTTHGPFSFNTFFDMTHSANGGDDKWNSHFLNMYCAETGGGLDGVGWMGSNILLVSYSVFGNSRVGTHEMGHVFGLSHIWGPEQSTGGFVCSSDDGITDTPEQWSPITTNGPFPVLDTCTATGNGIMYMNYMNYNFDSWVNMFSQGQVDEMTTMLNTTLNDMINNTGLSAAEVQFQKSISVYPNPASGKFMITTPENTVCQILITDFLGKEVFNSAKSIRNHFEVDLNLSTGIYLCRISSENYSVIKKIMVN